MKTVTLAGGELAMIDDEDYDIVSPHRWRLASGGYAQTTVCDKTVFMHRLVTGERGQFDHENRNRLDNQKHNLRPATQRQNMGNRSKSPGCSSKFKGVSWNRQKSKWQAHISANRKPRLLGMFVSESDAAQAYNKAAAAYFGEFALLNTL